jgi:hypothetical protein
MNDPYKEERDADFRSRMDGTILLLRTLLSEAIIARQTPDLEQAMTRNDRIMETLCEFIQGCRRPGPPQL